MISHASEVKPIVAISHFAFREENKCEMCKVIYEKTYEMGCMSQRVCNGKWSFSADVFSRVFSPKRGNAVAIWLLFVNLSAMNLLFQSSVLWVWKRRIPGLSSLGWNTLTVAFPTYRRNMGIEGHGKGIAKTWIVVDHKELLEWESLRKFRLSEAETNTCWIGLDGQ